MSSLVAKKPGLLFLLSAPAGTGKTTLMHKLMGEFPEVIANISYTTRLPRVGEEDGKDYYFISQEQFEEKIASGEFLEYVRLYDTYYGSSRRWVERQLALGKHVFLVIDTQGARKVRESVSVTSIFLRPPSLQVLRARLLHRQTESIEKIEERLAWAEKELRAAKEYEYQVVNEDLEMAYQVLRSILIATCHKSENREQKYE